jgi:formate hydrogenlyase subunit 3/multisubunit Na+/H+ antiporter MnhD subunit
MGGDGTGDCDPMSTVLLLSILFPAVLAGALTGRGRVGRIALAATPVAAVPALLLSLASEAIPSQFFPWLLDGSLWGLDSTGQIFLLFSALLWTASGVFAMKYLEDDPRRARFFLFFLLTMSGNFGLIVAQDLMTFYLFFALMTFAGYGIVTHTRTPEARRAGHVYIVMAVAGETLLVIGLILAASGAESLTLADVAEAIGASPQRNLIVGLLLLGFAVKAGAIPLHVWLPLAHPVAPTPASAVLSGSMIKAGLLGWIRFLPLGIVALEVWGAIVIILGIAGAFFGVVIGVTQRDAKTTLAYSSISQMGLISIGIGAAMVEPVVWPVALGATIAYAAHHGLAKGALFLGVGVAAAAGSVWERRLALSGLVFAALAVAGAPLTSGSVAKIGLKEVAGGMPVSWAAALEILLPLAAVGTTLLMARFLFLVRREAAEEAHAGALPLMIWLPWVVLLAAVLVTVWILPHRYELDPGPSALYPAALWMSIWPVIAGLLGVWLTLILVRRARELGRIHVVPGDVLAIAEALLRRWRNRPKGASAEAPAPVVSLASRWYGVYAESEPSDPPLRMEIEVTRWSLAMLLFAVVLLLVVSLVWRGGLS